jgi:hypothetical protein
MMMVTGWKPKGCQGKMGGIKELGLVRDVGAKLFKLQGF